MIINIFFSGGISMGIHEFICRATKTDANCVASFDLTKALENQKKELENESLRKKALDANLILCYNQ